MALPDKYQWAEDYLNEVKDEAITALNELKLAGLGSFSVDWTQQANPVEFANINLEWNPPQLTIKDFEQQVVKQDAEINLLMAPIWEGSILTNIESTITSILTSGGLGLSPELQDAIFNTDSARRVQTLNDSILAASAAFGGRGFRNPSSILAASINELTTKYQMDRENQSREIVKIMEEHARQNVQYALQNGIEYEKMASDFVAKYNAIMLEATKVTVEQYVAEVQAEVSSYQAYINGILGQAEIAKATAAYMTSLSNAGTESYKADIEQEGKKRGNFLVSQVENAQNKIKAMAGYATTASELIKGAGLQTVQIATGKVA